MLELLGRNPQLVVLILGAAAIGVYSVHLILRFANLKKQVRAYIAANDDRAVSYNELYKLIGSRFTEYELIVVLRRLIAANEIDADIPKNARAQLLALQNLYNDPKQENAAAANNIRLAKDVARPHTARAATFQWFVFSFVAPELRPKQFQFFAPIAPTEPKR